MKLFAILVLLGLVGSIVAAPAPPKVAYRYDDDSGESDETDLADDEPQDDDGSEEEIGQNFDHMPSAPPSGVAVYRQGEQPQWQKTVPTTEGRPVSFFRRNFRDDDSDEEEDDEDEDDYNDDVVESDISYSPTFPASTWGESSYGVRRQGLFRSVPFYPGQGRSSSQSEVPSRPVSKVPVTVPKRRVTYAQMPSGPVRRPVSGPYSGNRRVVSAVVVSAPKPYRRVQVQPVRRPHPPMMYNRRNYNVVYVQRPMAYERPQYPVKQYSYVQVPYSRPPTTPTRRLVMQFRPANNGYYGVKQRRNGQYYQ